MSIQHAFAIVAGLMVSFAHGAASFSADEQKIDSAQGTVKPVTVVKKEPTVDGHFQDMLKTMERFQAAIADKNRDRTQWVRFPLQLKESLSQLRKLRELPEPLTSEPTTKAIVPKSVAPADEPSSAPQPTEAQVRGTDSLRKPDRDQLNRYRKSTLRDVPLEWIQRQSIEIEKQIDVVLKTLESPELDQERLKEQVRQLDRAIQRLAKPEESKPPKKSEKSGKRKPVEPPSDDKRSGNQSRR